MIGLLKSYLKCSNSDYVVKRRYKSVHTPVPINFCQSLLQQVTISLIYDWGCIGIDKLAAFRRDSGDSGARKSRNDGADIKSIGILGTISMGHSIKRKGTYRIRSIVIIAQLVDEELSDDRWCLAILEPNLGNSSNEALQ